MLDLRGKKWRGKQISEAELSSLQKKGEKNGNLKSRKSKQGIWKRRN